MSESHDAARRSYDRLSRTYDVFAAPFERGCRDAALAALSAREGERVLEIGHGTGHALVALAAAGARVVGLDLSGGMQAVARARVCGLEARVALVQGDASRLPFVPGAFDAAFASFALELFPGADLPRVLGEARRVLRPGGRIGLACMGVPERPSVATRLYAWAHRRLPALVDCRPIDAPALLRDAGFAVRDARRRSLAGLPVDIVVGERPVVR